MKRFKEIIESPFPPMNTRDIWVDAYGVMKYYKEGRWLNLNASEQQKIEVDDRITANEKGIAANTAAIGSVSTKVNTLSATVGTLGDTVTEVKDTVDNVSADVESVNEAITELEEAVSANTEALQGHIYTLSDKPILTLSTAGSGSDNVLYPVVQETQDWTLNSVDMFGLTPVPDIIIGNVINDTNNLETTFIFYKSCEVTYYNSDKVIYYAKLDVGKYSTTLPKNGMYNMQLRLEVPKDLTGYSSITATVIDSSRLVSAPIYNNYILPSGAVPGYYKWFAKNYDWAFINIDGYITYGYIPPYKSGDTEYYNMVSLNTGRLRVYTLNRSNGYFSLYRNTSTYVASILKTSDSKLDNSTLHNLSTAGVHEGVTLVSQNNKDIGKRFGIVDVDTSTWEAGDGLFISTKGDITYSGDVTSSLAGVSPITDTFNLFTDVSRLVVLTNAAITTAEDADTTGTSITWALADDVEFYRTVGLYTQAPDTIVATLDFNNGDETVSLVFNRVGGTSTTNVYTAEYSDTIEYVATTDITKTASDGFIATATKRGSATYIILDKVFSTSTAGFTGVISTANKAVLNELPTAVAIPLNNGTTTITPVFYKGSVDGTAVTYSTIITEDSPMRYYFTWDTDSSSIVLSVYTGGGTLYLSNVGSISDNTITWAITSFENVALKSADTIIAKYDNITRNTLVFKKTNIQSEVGNDNPDDEIIYFETCGNPSYSSSSSGSFTNTQYMFMVITSVNYSTTGLSTSYYTI